MQHSKFCALFKRISATEAHAFYKYLKQMHGAQTLILRCYEYVREFHPHQMEDPGLDLEQVYSALFRATMPEDKQHASRKNLSNTLSELYLHLRRFLLHEKLRTDPVEEQALWLLVLQERGWKEEFSKQATAFYSNAQAVKQKDISDSLQLVKAGYFHRQHLSTVHQQENGATLVTYLEELNTCYHTIRSKLICELTHLKQVTPDQSTLLFPPERAPLLHLYNAIYQLLSAPSKAHFETVRLLLNQTVVDLAPARLNEILIYVYNYGAAMSRSSTDPDLIQNIHAFNKFADQYGFFETKGLISTNTFNSTVNVACFAKDYQWANALIQKMTAMMPLTAILLAKADVLFAEKEYQKVLKLVKLSSFRGFNDILRARLLLIRSYYCDGTDPEQTMLCYNNFESWLRRNRDKQAGHVTMARAFLNIFNCLSQEKISPKALTKLLEATPTVYCKTWLHEQASHYKGRYANHKSGNP